MAKQHDIDKVAIVHNDSSNPGVIRVEIDVTDGPNYQKTTLRLPIADAAELAERLHYAVRQSGYELVARKRNSR